VQHRNMQQISFEKGAEYVAMHTAKAQGVNWVVDMILSLPDAVRQSIEYYNAQEGKG